MFPLSVEEKDGALSAEGGEGHRLTQDQIMGWMREGRLLAPEDAEALLAFIRQPKPPGLKPGEWEERVNEILNFLRTQTGGVAGLAEAMLEMAAEEANPVLRMYALQHIAMWIPDEPSEKSREAMMGFLSKLAGTADHPLAGSAVLFMSDLDRSGELPGGFTAVGDIGGAALRIASDATAAPDVRIAALHACVDQYAAASTPAAKKIRLERRLEITATARAIAADTSLMIPLRKAAIHAMGQFGTQEDVALLEELENGNLALAAATKPAIKKLEDSE